MSMSDQARRRKAMREADQAWTSATLAAASLSLAGHLDLANNAAQLAKLAARLCDDIEAAGLAARD